MPLVTPFVDLGLAARLIGLKSMRGPGCLLLLAVLLLAGPAFAESPGPPPGMALIPGGSYKPLYSKEAARREAQPSFMDVMQVTNGEFLAFVRAHPEWQRSKVSRTRADKNYLTHWLGDLDLGAKAPVNAPVTLVSWFAAQAYCEAHGKRLPTQDEWEFAARADATRADASTDQAFLRLLLEWYTKPATTALEDVHSGILNVHGLRGMHGLVWEWVHDFNSTMIAGDSRSDGSLERQLFCGAGSLLAADVSNYAAYMRFAFRSSLQGNYCVSSLGFRAAKSVTANAKDTSRSSVLTTPYDLPGEWRTQDGKPVILASLRGKVRVITMGFTRCKFACPRIFNDMQRVETALGAGADRVGFTFLSIDPQNDTPARMTAKMAEMKMNPARWTFLTAPDATVQQLAVAMNFKFQLVEGFFAHSNLIAVLDENGHVLHREESLGADIEPTVSTVQQQLSKR
jgi:formylglycine-generating enzyme required for sulfatase activity